jgi:hypothetical protein
MSDKGNARTGQLAKVLSARFTRTELRTLMAATALIERQGASI